MFKLSHYVAPTTGTCMQAQLEYYLEAAKNAQRLSRRRGHPCRPWLLSTCPQLVPAELPVLPREEAQSLKPSRAHLT